MDANARLRGKGVVTEIQFLNVQRSHEEAVANVLKFESQEAEARAEKVLLDKRYAAAKGQHDRTLADLRDQLEQARTNRSAAEAETTQRMEEYEVADKDARRKRELALFRRTQAEEQARLNLRGYSDQQLDDVAEGVRLPGNNMPFTAPEDGRVAKLLVRNPGETVQRGQSLMTIVPTGVDLVAEIRIANRDIGQIKKHQFVQLKLDAFPFADHGVLPGKLGAPLEDAEAPEGKVGDSYYRVYACLKHQTINGKRLLSGMSGVAEVRTEQKTILELILKPLMELRKPKEASS
jgi:HlyD family secretion protein